MHILLIKTSSLGDIVHTLPAISDIAKHVEHVCIDWVVEPNFLPLAQLHPAVRHCYGLPLRKYRQTPWKLWQHILPIRAIHYDFIIDAQGIICKSAVLGTLLHGPVHGYDRHSIREPLATLLYQHRHSVDKSQHAVERTRALCAQTCMYTGADDASNFSWGIPNTRQRQAYGVFIHASSWPEKSWQQQAWVDLAQQLSPTPIFLPWGNEREQQQAINIAKHANNVTVLANMDIAAIIDLLATAKFCVSLDTGLSHIAAMLNTPQVSLYPATSPKLTGVLGGQQIAISPRKPQYKKSIAVLDASVKTTHRQLHITQVDEISVAAVLNQLQLLLKYSKS